MTGRGLFHPPLQAFGIGGLFPAVLSGCPDGGGQNSGSSGMPMRLSTLSCRSVVLALQDGRDNLLKGLHPIRPRVGPVVSSYPESIECSESAVMVARVAVYSSTELLVSTIERTAMTLLLLP